MARFLSVLALGVCCVWGGSLVADELPALAKFQKPQRLKAGAGYVKVEAPGFASPCWADVDGDGKKDLLVGQFAGGKIKFYKNLGQGKLAAGEWLQAGGKVAEVPGVW